jgi:uncharacterized protein (DUF2237 family)
VFLGCLGETGDARPWVMPVNVVDATTAANPVTKSGHLRQVERSRPRDSAPRGGLRAARQSLFHPAHGDPVLMRPSVLFAGVFAVVFAVVCVTAFSGACAAPVPAVANSSHDNDTNNGSSVASSTTGSNEDQCIDDRCALGLAEAGVAVATAAQAVTGAPLALCGLKPLTGFVRDGVCRTGVDDVGAHTVCGEVTASFLAFSKSRGNDLVTPRGDFAGLVPGDRWCLCESRVQEAFDAGVRVPVVLSATNAAALRTLSKQTLEELGALASDGGR